MEGVELSRRLAKQVLSQLNYTPTDGTCIDFKAFATVRKLRKPTFQDVCLNWVTRPSVLVLVVGCILTKGI
jgi:hypothetical protein